MKVYQTPIPRHPIGQEFYYFQLGNILRLNVLTVNLAIEDSEVGIVYGLGTEDEGVYVNLTEEDVKKYCSDNSEDLMKRFSRVLKESYKNKIPGLKKDIKYHQEEIKKTEEAINYYQDKLKELDNGK